MFYLAACRRSSGGQQQSLGEDVLYGKPEGKAPRTQSGINWQLSASASGSNSNLTRLGSKRSIHSATAPLAARRPSSAGGHVSERLFLNEKSPALLSHVVEFASQEHDEMEYLTAEERQAYAKRQQSAAAALSRGYASTVHELEMRYYLPDRPEHSVVTAPKRGKAAAKGMKSSYVLTLRERMHRTTSADVQGKRRLAATTVAGRSSPTSPTGAGSKQCFATITGGDSEVDVGEMLGRKKQGLRKLAKCTLCEQSFATALPTSVSLRSVLARRLHWVDEMPVVAAGGASAKEQRERRMAEHCGLESKLKHMPPSFLYRSVPVCRFCGQYFGVYFGERFEETSKKTARRPLSASHRAAIAFSSSSSSSSSPEKAESEKRSNSSSSSSRSGDSSAASEGSHSPVASSRTSSGAHSPPPQPSPPEKKPQEGAKKATASAQRVPKSYTALYMKSTARNVDSADIDERYWYLSKRQRTQLRIRIEEQQAERNKAAELAAPEACEFFLGDDDDDEKPLPAGAPKDCEPAPQTEKSEAPVAKEEKEEEQVEGEFGPVPPSQQKQAKQATANKRSRPRQILTPWEAMTTKRRVAKDRALDPKKMGKFGKGVRTTKDTTSKESPEDNPKTVSAMKTLVISLLGGSSSAGALPFPTVAQLAVKHFVSYERGHSNVTWLDGEQIVQGAIESFIYEVGKCAGSLASNGQCVMVNIFVVGAAEYHPSHPFHDIVVPAVGCHHTKVSTNSAASLLDDKQAKKGKEKKKEMRRDFAGISVADLIERCTVPGSVIGVVGLDTSIPNCSVALSRCILLTPEIGDPPGTMLLKLAAWEELGGSNGPHPFMAGVEALQKKVAEEKAARDALPPFSPSRKRVPKPAPLSLKVAVCSPAPPTAQWNPELPVQPLTQQNDEGQLQRILPMLSAVVVNLAMEQAPFTFVMLLKGAAPGELDHEAISGEVRQACGTFESISLALTMKGLALFVTGENCANCRELMAVAGNQVVSCGPVGVVPSALFFQEGGMPRTAAQFVDVVHQIAASNEGPQLLDFAAAPKT